MRNFFLKNKEYSHLVLATDDIVVKPEHINLLEKDLQKYDYPVLTGLMNVDLDDVEFVNLSMSLPLKKRRLRQYSWMTRREVFVKDEIFQVAFSGFPLMAIRRDIVEKVPFDADRVFEGLPPERGASLDFVYCWYCQEKDIPIMVDKRIDMLHLRTKGGLMLNNKHKQVKYYLKGQPGTEIEIDDLR